MPQRLSRPGFIYGRAILFIALAGLGLILVSSLALRGQRTPAEDVAASAREYLDQQGVKPLEADWQKAASHTPEASLPHPLLNKPAPDFTLPCADGPKISLVEQLTQGPVVLVFYYGYYCNHCVAQLFALEADLEKFRAAGGQIITISPDSPEQTREKFAKYGEFSFPVLADKDNAIAATYSLLLPPTTKAAQRLLHGTFIIDQTGQIRWCHYGTAPFTDNATLLHELASLSAASSPTLEQPAPSRTMKE